MDRPAQTQIDIPTPPRISPGDVKQASVEEDDSEGITLRTGKAQSDAESGWYRVDFLQPFEEGEEPTVVVTAIERKGDFEEGEFAPPEIEIEEVRDIDIYDPDIPGVVLPEPEPVDIPTVDIDGVSLDALSLDRIDISRLQIGRTSLSTPSIDPISLPSTTLDPVTLNRIDLTAPEVSDFDIDLTIDEFPDIDAPIQDHDISLRDIDVEPDIDNVEPPGVDIDQLGSFDIELVEQMPDFDPVEDLEEFGRKPFSERFAEGSRNMGEGFYDAACDDGAFSVLPSIAGYSLEDYACSAFDSLMKAFYGYGSSASSSTGIYEFIMYNIGNVLDVVVEDLVGLDNLSENRVVNEVNDTIVDDFEETHEEITRWIESDLAPEIQDDFMEIVGEPGDSGTINNALYQFEQNLSDTVYGEDGINAQLIDTAAETSQELQALSAEADAGFDMVTDAFEVLQDQTNASFDVTEDGFDAVLSELERVEDDLVDEINTSLDNTVSEAEEGLNDLSDNVESQVEELRSEVESTILEVTDEVETAFAESDSNLVEYTEQLEDDINDIISEVEAQSNLGYESVEAELNGAIENIESEINSALLDDEAAINNLSDEVEEELTVLSQELVTSYNTTLQTFRDDTQAELTGLRDSVNNAFDLALGDIQSALDGLNGDVNQSLSIVTGLAEEAMNQSQRMMYSSLGMPEGQLMTPVQIRNVDESGFEFLGYEGGMEIHFVAIGRGEGTALPQPTDPVREDVIEEIADRVEDRIGEE